MANLREHWAARARRTKAQREAVHLFWPRAGKGRCWATPIEVTLTRVYPTKGRTELVRGRLVKTRAGRELDDDNLASGLKAIRDQVAAELGIDDGDRARLGFRNLQERGSAWAVRIEVREVRT